MTRQELADAGMDSEWPMFSSVDNAGGKASCPMRPDVFMIMRSSQYNGFWLSRSAFCGKG